MPPRKKGTKGLLVLGFIFEHKTRGNKGQGVSNESNRRPTVVILRRYYIREHIRPGFHNRAINWANCQQYHKKTGGWGVLERCQDLHYKNWQAISVSVA